MWEWRAGIAQRGSTGVGHIVVGRGEWKCGERECVAWRVAASSSDGLVRPESRGTTNPHDRDSSVRLHGKRSRESGFVSRSVAFSR